MNPLTNMRLSFTALQKGYREYQSRSRESKIRTLELCVEAERYLQMTKLVLEAEINEQK
jgi:hypothetical protein